ncbi:MAG: hypothetical protein ABSG30_03155 [Steroidobacteraceae bacterium]|jgi:hypothetical protein
MAVTATDSVLERQALAWMDDPYGALGFSNTRMHSVPREEAEALQLAGINLRLEQRRAEIAVLAKLAEAQSISRITRLEEAAPLFFTHDMYKSYPVSLLSKSRFDQLTKWLDRLTPYDLSGLAVADCRSIDEWIDRLREQTPLDVATSSGTSGTMSFIPKTKRDYRTSVTGLRVQLTQRFGEKGSPADFDEPIHVLTPFYRDGYSTTARLPVYFLDIFCKGDPARLHTALPYKASADLIWLAARLRAAQAKGDTSRIDVPETLLSRRAEWERIVAETPARQAAFIREQVPELRGKRVFALGLTNLFYEIARSGLKEGVRAEFAPHSVAMAGGGGKGVVLPDDADEVIRAFFGVELRGAYGMSEQNFYLVTCDHERLHIPPWVTVLLLDPDSGRPLPREGVQTGRASFFDLTQDGHWGGIVSGDRITVDYRPCPCGRTTLAMGKKIQRFSEITGDEDKLTCAATPSAQAEALELLTSI